MSLLRTQSLSKRFGGGLRHAACQFSWCEKALRARLKMEYRFNTR